MIVRRAALLSAEQTTGALPSRLAQIIAVCDVRTDPDQVSGVLVNLSDKVLHDVRILVDRSWLWADERDPGAAEDDPGRAAVYTVPGEILPSGRLPFTYRGAGSLPQRPDGHFTTSVSVVGLDQKD